jgi:peptidoglycan/LPS O-acetylase OafA/YrhL
LGTNKIDQPKRLRNLDALRGICAILVVLAHTLPRQWFGMGLVSAHPFVYLDLGRIGVAAFFLISGYVIPFSIPNGESSAQKFWISRFFRLWPAYWVAMLFYLLTAPHQASRLTVAANLTMMQRFVGLNDLETSFWTLQVELIFYFLITLMLLSGMVRNTQSYRTLLYAMIGLSVALAPVRLLIHKNLPLLLPMGLALMFLSGYIRQCRLIGRAFPWATVAQYMVSLIAVCLLGYGSKLKQTDDPFRLIIAYTFGLMLFLVFERMQDAHSLAVSLGAISYSIYLLHPAVIALASRFLPARNPGEDALAIMLMTIIVAWIVFRLVELPGQRLGKAIAARVAPPPFPVSCDHRHSPASSL